MDEKMGMEEEIYLAPEEEAEKQSEREEPAARTEAEGEEIQVEEEKKKANAVSEIREMREENRKVYRMSDGSEQAVYYPEAVHVYDEETGEYEEVDNTLKEEEDGRHYRNGKNRFTARFSREENSDEMFSVEKGGCQLKVRARYSRKQKNRVMAPRLEKRPPDEAGAKEKEVLRFEKAMSGADMEYEVSGNGVKETIVVKEKAEVYRYPFTLECRNVSAEYQEEEKRVVFRENESGKEVFIIPAPYMRDAKGEISTGVFYEMKASGEGQYSFTVTADSEWINAEERAYPVEIDPQVLVEDGNGMTTYSWNNGYLYSTTLHTVGASGTGSTGCNAKRMYMKLKIPSLPRNPRIKKAEITFYQYGGVSECGSLPKLGLYQVTGEICTGNCTPVNDFNLLDYEKMKIGHMENGQVISYTIDITEFADKVNKGETGYPNLVLKMIDEDTSCNSYVTLYGSSYGGSYVPRISVTYESSYGMESTYRSHTHELGCFGQGSIDLACGNLMFSSDDFAWAGNRMPVTVRHQYNSALASYPYTANSAIKLLAANFSAMKLGFGWRLNLMQSVTSVSFQQDGKSYTGYVFVDENGSETYFKESDKTSCCRSNSQCYHFYEDVQGSELLYDPVQRTLMQYNPCNSEGIRVGEEKVFDVSGRLIRITDENGNHMDITYTSGRITSVTDGAGREFGFAYSDSGYLTSITAPDGTNVLYTYSGNLLASVTYPGGKKAVLTYILNKPASVTLQDGSTNVYKTEYAFSGDRLTCVTEYGVENGTFVKGASSSYNYSAASRRTIVETTQPKDAAEGETADQTMETVYTFDDDGNTVSEYVYTQESGNMGAEGEESGINPHSGKNGAGVVSNINNLLTGHNFESLDAWTGMPGNCGGLYISNYTYEPYTKYGKKLLRMQSDNADCKENGVYQVTNILPAGNYTFSVYLRVLSAFSGTTTPGAYLRVTDTADNVLAISEPLSAYDSDYIRLVAPFELTSSKSVKVQILVDGRGTVYADAAQLENNSFANAYNMLENGNFERSLSGWNTTAGASISTGTRFNMSRSLMMMGALDSSRYAYQAVTVKTNRSTKESFTLSGWAKGYGIVNRERDGSPDAQFRLRAVVFYYDTAYREYGSETFTADFAPATEEWQFASVQFAKSKYRIINNIYVYCDYSYNCGTVYFDDIQLVRDSLETGLAASDFAVESTDGSDDNEFVEQDIAPAFSEQTDKFGNVLTETTFTDGEFGTIYRSFEYTPDCNCAANAGNDLVKETDARRKETKYRVDEETSRNEEVTDRCGNKTAYEYDAAGRTTKVTSKSAADQEIAHVSYAYDTFDNLSEIVRGDGLKYVLEYNAFHHLESIGIEGKAEKLVTYGYKNGNGRLKEMIYANGDRMKATYNGLGKVVGERWVDKAGALTAQYKYVYDGKGNIVRSIDILQKKEYNYIYEKGRIVRSAEYTIALDSGEIVTQKNLENSIYYSYDSEGKLTKKRIVPASGAEQVIYLENPENENAVVKFTAGGKTITSHSKSDSFGRKVFDELQLGTGFVSRQFSYLAGDVTVEHKNAAKLKSTPTTPLISHITFSGGRTIGYEYDAEERITRVTDSVDGVTEYTYDALGQLLAETRNGEAVNVMTYDNYGNILTKNGKAYTYGDSAWKDILTAWDGQSITYDAQGNPTNYLGHTLIWEKGRQLKSFDSIRYTYNANGIRTSKTVNGITHSYTLDGADVLRETWGGNTLIPLYDNEDVVCGIVYNGEPYYFQKNLQGDVIALIEKDAKTVAKYTYDAWGACTVTMDTVGIANVNPYRYRSYYYDVETGMYYLQSRYYDPEIGRFVNMDAVVGGNDDIAAYNLYAYCGNVPVLRCDEFGMFWKEFIRGILHDSNNFVVSLGIDTAAIGAYFLMMKKDSNGVYHATFDCWQQYFGYNNLYDFFFDLGTDCKPAKFKFCYNRKNYIFWAWKADYINLGAGAEMGIYYGNDPHWQVDKKLAMPMTLKLVYKGRTIINHSDTTWWITGFNPRYLNVKTKDLKAIYTVRFTNCGMYNAFKITWRDNKNWSFWTECCYGMAKFSF